MTRYDVKQMMSFNCSNPPYHLAMSNLASQVSATLLNILIYIFFSKCNLLKYCQHSEYNKLNVAAFIENFVYI